MQVGLGMYSEAELMGLPDIAMWDVKGEQSKLT